MTICTTVKNAVCCNEVLWIPA